MTSESPSARHLAGVALVSATLLLTELVTRVNTNPAYSLRRFASQLGISPATLSGVLAGKRRLSLKTAARVCGKLALSPQSAAQFCTSVAAEQSKLPAPAASAEYLNLSADAFQLMSDWYHYAILELTFVKGAAADPRWFARKLGLSITQAIDAIERLKRLGLLEERRGCYVKTKARIASPDGVASSAVRKRHAQVLGKATESLNAHSLDERDFSAMTMAIDPELLPEAKKRIAAFRRELCEFLESGKRTRVYELSLQLFPLSTGDEK